MNSLKIVFAVVLAILAVSCVGVYIDMSYLTHEDLRWVEHRNMDTTVFDSDNGHVDTMILQRTTTENRLNPFYIHFVDNYKGNKYNAKAFAFASIMHETDSLNFIFRLTKDCENDSLKFSSDLHNFSTRGDWLPIMTKRIRINDRVLYECVVVDSTNARYSDYWSSQPKKIDRFIVSKEYGLVYYRFKTGEQFFRRFE